MRSSFQGLCTGPKQLVVPVPSNAISSRLSLPSSTVPAALSRAVTSASCVGTRSKNTSLAAVVRMPAVSKLSLIAIGMPCSGLPEGRRSHARACARANSSVTVIKLFRCASSFRMRARHTRVSSSEEISRFRSAAAASARLQNSGEAFELDCASRRAAEPPANSARREIRGLIQVV